MAITAPAAELAQGYEALRAQALGRIPATRPRGLAVLARSGLPAWMSALAPSACPDIAGPARGTGQNGSPNGVNGELVRLLAEMVMARCMP